MGTGSFPEVKRPGRVADHPPPSKCRGQERVGLYLYSPSGPVMGTPLPFTLFLCVYFIDDGILEVETCIRNISNEISFYYRLRNLLRQMLYKQHEEITFRMFILRTNIYGVSVIHYFV